MVATLQGPESSHWLEKAPAHKSVRCSYTSSIVLTDNLLTTNFSTKFSLRVTDLLKQAGDRELRKSARSFVLPLVLALLALACLPFIGEANLFPKFTRGSFLESPSRKCLQHTRDWAFNWLSSTPNAKLSQLALLLGSLGKRWKEASGSWLEVFPNTIQVCIQHNHSNTLVLSHTTTDVHTTHTVLTSKLSRISLCTFK